MPISDDITEAESSGNPMAKAKTSSATGLGQFVNATWLDMIRRYRPDLAQGKSDAEILELRNDPDYSREMTRRYAEENEAKLRQAGLPVTPGSTYLMHFAGPTGAVKLMQADPDTPVESILSAKAIESNPLLRGKTASWVIDYANRKIARASASKPWPPRDAHPVPYLAQTQALEPAFGATQWLQRPTSPNVLQPDTAPPFAPSTTPPRVAATQYLDETRRAQQVLGNLPHAPSAVPQPAAPISPLQNGGPKPPQHGPTAPPAQLQPPRPGSGPPLDITPRLAPGMPNPGAAGPGPVTDGLPPLHFAPETPQRFGPFEVPGLFRSDVFGGPRVAPAADGMGTNPLIPPTPAFGAPGTSAPATSPAASGTAGQIGDGNSIGDWWKGVAPAAAANSDPSSVRGLTSPMLGMMPVDPRQPLQAAAAPLGFAGSVPRISAPTVSGMAAPPRGDSAFTDWWNGLVADVDAASRRAGLGGLSPPVPNNVPAPPTQPVFDRGLPGMLQRAGAFDPSAGGLLGRLLELQRNHPDDDR